MSHHEPAHGADSSEGHHGEAHQHVGYGVFVLVWLALLTLTAITVSAAGVELGDWNVYIALAIASVKVLLVLAIFMHMKYESRLFRLFLAGAILILGIILSLTYVDTSIW
jgi:cytochrome c oxidase subunit IV